MLLWWGVVYAGLSSSAVGRDKDDGTIRSPMLDVEMLDWVSELQFQALTKVYSILSSRRRLPDQTHVGSLDFFHL